MQRRQKYKVYFSAIIILLLTCLPLFSQHSEVKQLTESENVTNIIEPNLLYKILEWSIIIFIIAFILLFLATLIHRQIIKWEVSYTAKNNERLDNFLATYVSDDWCFTPDSQEIMPSEIEDKLIHEIQYKKKIRRLLKSKVVSLYQVLGGEEANKLRDLYIQLKFQESALKRTKSYLTVVAVPAIRELRNMNITHLFPDIYKLIQHKNPHISFEAMRLWILTEDEPFAFLREVTKPLSTWHQAQLVEAAVKLPYHKQPSFSQWLGHSNPSVVSFLTHCVKALNQENLEDTVMLNELD